MHTKNVSHAFMDSVYVCICVCIYASIYAEGFNIEK